MRQLPNWMAALIIVAALLIIVGIFVWQSRRQASTPQVPAEVLEKFQQGGRPHIPGMGPAAVPRAAPSKGQ